jgi:hypothetical protein
MAKYPKLDEPVFITHCDMINSPRYGGEIYEIKFKGVKTQADYHTYADPQNLNWRNWEYITRIADRKGIVLSGCKLKDTETNLINADSQVEVAYVVTKEELADILAEYWSAQDRFKGLFD